jgi:hypothetical protein
MSLHIPTKWEGHPIMWLYKSNHTVVDMTAQTPAYRISLFRVNDFVIPVSNMADPRNHDIETKNVYAYVDAKNGTFGDLAYQKFQWKDIFETNKEYRQHMIEGETNRKYAIKRMTHKFLRKMDKYYVPLASLARTPTRNSPRLIAEDWIEYLRRHNRLRGVVDYRASITSHANQIQGHPFFWKNKAGSRVNDPTLSMITHKQVYPCYDPTDPRNSGIKDTDPLKIYVNETCEPLAHTYSEWYTIFNQVYKDEPLKIRTELPYLYEVVPDHPGSEPSTSVQHQSTPPNSSLLPSNSTDLRWQTPVSLSRASSSALQHKHGSTVHIHQQGPAHTSQAKNSHPTSTYPSGWWSAGQFLLPVLAASQSGPVSIQSQTPDRWVLSHHPLEEPPPPPPPPRMPPPRLLPSQLQHRFWA